ncbi:MAG: hypothetical protein AB1898_06710 [Acidobacteriota bacterium]
MTLDPQSWAELLRRITADVMAWLPALAGALALLLLGWVVARLVQAFLGGLLKKLGLDRLAQRSGASQTLAGWGIDSSVAGLLARIVFWIVFLLFVLAASESLGLRGLAGTMSALVAYLPKVIAACFILLLGGLIARLVGDGVGAVSVQSGVAAGPLVGQIVRYVLLVFIVILAVDQLGVSTQLLTTATIVIVAAAALALAVALGLGSRELAHDLMAGFHAKDEFVVGQNLVVRSHQGRLVSIGPVKSLIETREGLVSLPNRVLTEEEVVIQRESEAAG